MDPAIPAIEKANVWGLIGLKKGAKRPQHKVLNDLYQSTELIKAPDEISDDRRARRLAFRGIKRQMTLWKGPVYRNRLAKQLVFPLNDTSMIISDFTKVEEQKCDVHIKETKKEDQSLPGKLYNALYRDQSIPIDNKDSSASHIRKKLLETIAMRQKERYLLARDIAKNTRRNKIKSKNFHKHMKKRTLKEFESNMEKMKETNPKAFAEKLYRAEVNRANERASLRHRGGSKFARLQKLRAKYDTEARNAVAEMHEYSKELTKHRGSNESSDSEDSDIDVTSESDCSSSETEFSEDDSHENKDDTTDTVESLCWWRKDDQNKNSSLKSKSAQRKPVFLSTLSVESMLDQQSEAKIESETINLAPDNDPVYQTLEETGALDPTLQEHFAHEKSEVVAEETPADIDTFLPGWNTWTGPGLEAQEEERRKKRRIPAPKVNRDDKDKPHLVIRRRVNTDFKQHLVKSIPFPYNTPDQFESFIAQPVSREWLTESTHCELTRPKVTVQSGRIIRPISKSVALLRDRDVERLVKQIKNP